MPAQTRALHARPPGATLLAVLVAAAAFGGSLVGLALGDARGASDSDDAVAVAAAPSPSIVPSSTPSPSVTASPSVTPSPEPPPTVEFTLVAAGDFLTHTPVNASARTEDGYDFTRLMANVEPYIAGADLALCHLETPVAPAGVAPSGYPRFAGPAEMVRDLAAVGWDGCSFASNHTVDQGYAGVEATHAAFAENGLAMAGSALTEDAPSTALYEITTGDRAITVAQISYSYGTNGLPVPEGQPWTVNLFDADAADAAPIIEAAREAREAGADVVVASVHCCVEYRTEPTDAQRSIAQQIADSGEVDLYIGHHAHVPQPIELLDGGPAGAGMWTAFGLGNFLSNQDGACCAAETGSGVLLSATFAVDPEGAVDVNVEWTGTTLDRRDRHTLQILEAIQDTGAGTLSSAVAQDRLALVRAAVGGQAQERSEPIDALADAVDNGVAPASDS